MPKLGGNKNFLLHATEHRTMDYTARDEAPRGSNPLLSHFVAVFDPRTGGLQVVEAKKMAIRGAVRAKQASSDEMAADDVKQVSSLCDGTQHSGLTWPDPPGTEARPWPSLWYKESEESTR